MSVVETITFRLRDGASVDEFVALDSAAEEAFIRLQPGYVPNTRRTTISDTGEVTVSLEWESVAAADASMAIFADSPASEAFMGAIDVSTMASKRETRLQGRGQGVQNARGLYLDGIRDGHARDAVTKYTGARYTQHSTGVRDGIDGFVEFFDPFIAAHPRRDVELVRTFQDGRFVFVHAYQSIDDGEAEWVTTDLFDTDGNGAIIEHWDVISAFVGANPSGHTQVDGPTEVVDHTKTEANKALVADFMQRVLIEGNFSSITDYISAEEYVQHNSQVADGIEGFAAFAEKLAADGGSMVYDRVHRLVGQGNFVAALSEMTFSGQAMAVFDIFRLTDGLIVEHWDNMEPVVPDDVNSGKF